MPSLPSVPRICVQCGKDFLALREKVEQGIAIYCSRPCYAAARQKRRVLICPMCGVSFAVQMGLSDKGLRLYCSRPCQSAAKVRGTYRPCKQCGQSFFVPEAKARKSQGIFCSHACHGLWSREHWKGEAHPLWQGGARYERLNAAQRAAYREWRTAVFVRDGRVCQHCDEKATTINAHHIKPWARFPDLRYDVANGVTLCKPCHLDAHRKKTP